MPPDPVAASRSAQLDELERLLSLCEVQAVRSGSPLPLGATRRGHGINFAVFSRHATGVRLDFFDRVEDARPSRTVILDPVRNKTGDIWHVWLEDIGPGHLYGFRFSGPYDPPAGHRYNPDKLLLDPYATAVVSVPRHDSLSAPGSDGSGATDDPSFPGKDDPAPSSEDNAATASKCVICHRDFDWQGDQPLLHPWESTVIYELHVRGYTIHPTSGVAVPGTFRALAEKIPHLKELGITAVELMPVQEFNEHLIARIDPRTGERLRNFWGYDPVCFSAPKASYATVQDAGAQVLEFREMVRTFHRADIEVILDVVFNHTAEGNELGPTLSFRGIDNSIYYWLDDDKRFYRDFTGTGQTINAAHPVVRDTILDSLRYWVMEMHVDGFRFDLASVLGRDRWGHVLADSPLLERIAEDPILRNTKLIAEAWDAGGAYQVGSFSERRWAEWNGHFRDDVRRFWRGEDGMIGAFASRIGGSSDLYTGSGKGPESSINFITCHDGFTLNDLVSYSHKHNDANGEGGRDGAWENFSSNYGVEGPSADTGIETVRVRQIKNFLLTVAVSRGVPMLMAGDEFRRTQGGNNNAYCQDNETSWIDWSLLERNRGIFEFACAALAFRRRHPVLRREAFYTAEEITWFRPDGKSPDWSDARQRCLACWIHARGSTDLYLMCNAEMHDVTFAVPPTGRGWRVALDTAGGTTVQASRVALLSRSMTILVAAS